MKKSDRPHWAPHGLPSCHYTSVGTTLQPVTVFAVFSAFSQHGYQIHPRRSNCHCLFLSRIDILPTGYIRGAWVVFQLLQDDTSDAFPHSGLWRTVTDPGISWVCTQEYTMKCKAFGSWDLVANPEPFSTVVVLADCSQLPFNLGYRGWSFFICALW